MPDCRHEVIRWRRERWVKDVHQGDILDVMPDGIREQLSVMVHVCRTVTGQDVLRVQDEGCREPAPYHNVRSDHEAVLDVQVTLLLADHPDGPVSCLKPPSEAFLDESLIELVHVDEEGAGARTARRF